MAKISPQAKANALQVASVVASGLAERGVIPTDKAMRNVCLSGLKLANTMEQVIAVVEKNDELLTLPLDVAHATLHDLVIKANKDAAEQKAAEEAAAAKAAETKTEAPAK